MTRIRWPELRRWVLADHLADNEDHAVTFVDLPEGVPDEHLQDGLCVAMRVFEEVRTLLSARPGRRAFLCIPLETDSVCPASAPRTRQAVEASLDYSPPSIYLHDTLGPAYEQSSALILVENLEIRKVFEGCSVIGQGLVAKYVIFKLRVAWDPGIEYSPNVLVAEAKWLPSDRDLRVS